MTGKQIWYPGRSRTHEAEKGRGSYKQQVTACSSQSCIVKPYSEEKRVPATEERTTEGYSTVESGKQSILDYSAPFSHGTSLAIVFN